MAEAHTCANGGLLIDSGLIASVIKVDGDEAREILAKIFTLKKVPDGTLIYE